MHFKNKSNNIKEINNVKKILFFYRIIKNNIN